jgi:cysteine desulfurase/selenocysteine lyase
MEEVHIVGQAKEKSAILSFVIENTHPLDIATVLNLKGIAVRTGHLCAQPTLKQLGYNSIIRMSFGLYNTLEEIDQVAEALKDAMILVS